MQSKSCTLTVYIYNIWEEWYDATYKKERMCNIWNTRFKLK